MARGCQAQHLIWVVLALSSSILYDIWINVWTVAVFYWDHVYHSRSQQITADHGISQQITADHGRSRHISSIYMTALYEEFRKSDKKLEKVMHLSS